MNFSQTDHKEYDYWVRIDGYDEYSWAEIVKDNVGYSIRYLVEDVDVNGFYIFDRIDFFQREDAEDELKSSGYDRYTPKVHACSLKPKGA